MGVDAFRDGAIRMYSGAVADVELLLSSPEFKVGAAEDDLTLSNCLISTTIQTDARAAQKIDSNAVPKALRFTNAGKISTAHNGVWTHLNGYADDVVFTSFLGQEVQALRLWESKQRIGSNMPRPLWYLSNGSGPNAPLTAANIVRKLTNQIDSIVPDNFPISCNVGRLARTFQNVGVGLTSYHGVLIGAPTGIAYEIDANCSNTSAWVRPSIDNGEQASVSPPDRGVLFPATPASIVWSHFGRLDEQDFFGTDVKLTVNEQLCRLPAEGPNGCKFNVGWIGLRNTYIGNPVYELKRRLIGSTNPADLVTVGAPLIFLQAPNDNSNEISAGDRLDPTPGNSNEVVITNAGRYQYEMWETLANESRLVGKSETVYVLRADRNSQSLQTQLKCQTDQSPNICRCSQGAQSAPPYHCIDGGAAPTLHTQPNAKIEFSFLAANNMPFEPRHSVNPGCAVSLERTETASGGRRTMTLTACRPSVASSTANVRYTVTGTGSPAVLPQPNPGFLVVVNDGPEAPTQLSGVETSVLAYQLRWNFPALVSAGITFNIESKKDGLGWVAAGNANGVARTFDGVVLQEGTYKFRINACLQNVCSGWATTADPLGLSGISPALISVSLIGLPSNSTFAAPATINLNALAAVERGSIQRVEFYRGTTLVGTALNPILNTNTNTYSASAVDSNVQASATPYTYTAKAFDTAVPANVATSVGVLVKVEGGAPTNTLPPALTPAASAPPTAAEILASSKVGTLDGSLRVSESGAVNFSMAFLTAPGKGGLVPEIGLAYSGDTSQGVAGVGFNLTGLSAVSRCRKTIEAGDGPGPHPQVNFDAVDSNDAFCLDGQRLLQVSTGTQTFDGVSYSYTEYRTEIDTFQRVRAYASAAAAAGEQLVHGPLFWRVEGKDGSIMDFGRSYSDLVTNAAVYANDGQLQLIDPSTNLKIPRRLLTNARHHVATWALSATGDRLGSRVRYRYETGYTGADADPFVAHFLSRVFYTGFNNGTVIRQEHAALTFDYRQANYTKSRSGWSAGTYSELNRELVRVRSCLRANPAVTITAQELDAANAAGLCDSAATTLRVYALQYSIQADTAEVATEQPLEILAGKYGSGRSRLTSIQTCADVDAVTCWPATTLNWTESKAGFDFYSTSMGGAQFQRASGVRFSDVTGDGKPDVIWREELTDNQPDKIRFNRTISTQATGNGVSFGPTLDIAKVPDALDNNLYGNDPDRNWGLLDVNGDSLEDLVNTESVGNNGENNVGPWGWYVRLATGTDTGFSTQRTQLAGTNTFNGSGIVAQFQFTDVDGDGTVDMLSPKELVGGLTLQIAKGIRQANGSMNFATPIDVQLDFGAGGSGCYRVGFGRKHQADRWDSYDFNGDALADLTLRVQNTCKATIGGSEKPGATASSGYQFGLNAEPVLRINTEIPNGPENPAANLVEWGVFVAQNLSTFKLTYQPFGIADTEGAMRPTDLNGDGLMDLVTQAGQEGKWNYQLNIGNGKFGTQYCLVPNDRWVRPPGGGLPAFSLPSCLATKLPNTQSNLISDGQILLQDFDGDGFSDVWHSEKDPINQQSSSGKRFRVYRWKGGASNCNTFPSDCSDFERRKYVAVGSVGQDLLTIPTGVWTNAITGGSQAWRHLFADLDNDGYGDSFAYKKEADVATAGYILIRSTDHHQPRDVITSITSGFGAITNFSYSPLSYSSVYTRDYNATKITGWGRGSSIVDLNAPSYVVTSMSTPAPLASNAANKATMHYRYQGMKAQVGGRGSLGFRKIYTLNAQNNVETSTEYVQQFPLAGRPLMTQSRALNAAGSLKWKLSCNPDVAPSSPNACYYPQPQCASGACGHFSGSDADPTARGITLARNSDINAWRTRALSGPAYGSENAALMPGTPAIIHVYAKQSVSERFESAGALQNTVIASSVNKFHSASNELGYDDYGNLKFSVVESYAGEASGTPQSKVSSSSVYTNDPATWLLGRMTSTNVTHERPGQTTEIRTSAFSYDANGQLFMERVQPGSAEFQMTKYTLRHPYGMPSVSYSCSKAVEDNQRCTQNFVLGNQVVGDARLWVYRYAESEYDDVTGLPTTAYVLRGTGTPSKVSSGTTSYNKWGSPMMVLPVDGASVETTYDDFGRAVHQYSATGAQSTTLLARCGVDGVTCPAEAVTRSETRVAGGGRSWVYVDALARTVVGLTEQFVKNRYALSRAEFDGLGRQIRQSEPYQTSIGPNAANSLPSASGVPFTESCYDVGGRVIYLKLPNHVGAFSCANPPTPAQLASTAPDSINVIATMYKGFVTTTLNGMGQAQSTTVNAMGETVMAEDANGFKTDFVFDALGNLKSVTRGAGTPAQTVSSMLYDIMGRRTSINDPDAGNRRSYYSPAGESIREIDAKDQCMQSTLDFNGRVVRLAEHSTSSGDSCAGTAVKTTSTVYDRDKLGSVSSVSYGLAASALEAGSVRIDMLYDSFSRPVSTQRCVNAVSLARTDALNCKVDQQAFDQYSRAYWASDASSENVLHQVDVYAAGGVRRGTRMYYSDATSLVDGIPITAGFAYKTTALDGSAAYYEVLESNARGQVTKERVDGKPAFVTTRGYENSTGRLLNLNTGALQNLAVTYDELGNLRSRTDLSAGRNLVEKFEDYDLLNRVKKAELFSGKNAAVSQGVLTMAYSSDGNITNKTGTGSYLQAHIGGYEYGTVSGVHIANCAQGSVHAVGAISDTGYCYDPNGNQTKSTRRADAGSQRLIYYTVFDKPSQIDSLEVGGPGHSTKYGYGPAREMAYRIDVPLFAGSSELASVEVQYFGGVERELRKLGAGLTKETYKRMIGGVIQIVEERTVNESTTTVTVANATIKSEVMLKDHLGSTHVIVNSDGTDPQYQRFDVWGMRADAGTGSTQSLPQAYQSNNPNDASKTRTRKGFTGHEMVDGAGIVHMQGRIYDPRLGRFLQADPIIQDPLNAQNYNRYTYVYNNPLSLTDPSGYRSLSANLELYWKPVATIAIAVITQQYAAAAKIAGATLATQAAIVATGGAVIGLVNTGTLRGTVTGAFDSLLTFGIGEGFKGSWKALVIAHSLKGGMLEAMNGGDFGHGFATAGLSKIVGFGVDTLEVGDPLKIVIQSLAGGTVSAASGDGFANGAVSAALQFAFNQVLSNGSEASAAPSNDDIIVGFIGAGDNDLPDNEEIYALGEEIGASVYEAKGLLGAPIGKARTHILAQLKQSPSSRVFIFGYSAGGQAAFDLASSLEKLGVPVQGLVLFDPHHHLRLSGTGKYDIPSNVGNVLNIFQQNPEGKFDGSGNPFLGGKVRACFACAGDANIDLTGTSVVHTNIVGYSINRYKNEILSTLGR